MVRLPVHWGFWASRSSEYTRFVSPLEVIAGHDQLTISQIYRGLGIDQGILEPERGRLDDARLPPDAFDSFIHFLADFRGFRLRRRRRRDE